MTTDLTRLHAHHMAARLRAGELTSRELTEAHLDLAEAQDHGLHAWLTIDRDRALAEADAADVRLAAARGEGREALKALHPLLGIPVGLKDLVSVKGGQATAGSRILEGYLAPYDAHITERLRDVGRGHPRQDEHGRVRDGLIDRAFRVRPDGQPVGARSRAGWQQRWVRRGRVGLPRAAVHRDGHGRLHPPAGRAHGDRRAQTHVRAGQPVRDHRLRELARPDRAVRARRAGSGGAAACGGRSRRARFDLIARTRLGRSADARPQRRRGGRLAARQASGAPEGVFRRRHGAGRRGSRARGGGRAGGRRRHRRRSVAAAHGIRPRDVLHRRPGRGVREPRPLRRHPLRPATGRGP